MDVVSVCALRASGFEWQPRVGTYALTVLCKATFELRPNECALSPEQEEPSDTDTYWNDDPTRSAVATSDRAPYKPRADVVLVGHAYAPSRNPARSIMTRLLVGEIDKSIEVWCDRGVLTHAGQLLEGQHQAKMLLTWERAAGGPDTNNPVGMRFDAAPNRYGMVAVPNLQPPAAHFGKWGDGFAPVGYGPIAPHWPSRMQKLYRHAASFAARGWEERPLPDHFEYGYFNVAPPDQQLDELRPNERIVLENLHPQHERLVTNLPGLRPRAVADRATGEREEITLTADTLWLDTDRCICTVVWRGQIGLRRPREAGRVAFWVDGLPAASAASSPPRQAPLISDPNARMRAMLDAGSTLVPVPDAGQGPALPFEKGTPAPPPFAGISGAAPPPLLGPLASVRINDETGTLTGALVEPARAPLPFVRGAEAWSDSGGGPAAAPAHGDAGTEAGDMAVGPTARRAATSTPVQSFAAPEPLPPPVFVAAAVPIAFAMDEEPETARGLKPAAITPEPEARPPEVARPPMIGPLAAAEIEAEGARSDKEERAPPAPQRPSAPVDERSRIKDFPLERCAALTARIARSKPEKARILEEEKLSADLWAAIEKHWADAIRDETKRGKKTMLDRFDGAYVEQLERERGPIDVRDYTRLVVAAERGVADEILEGMGLPPGVLIRLERLWLRRLAEDAELGRRLELLVEEQRAE